MGSSLAETDYCFSLIISRLAITVFSVWCDVSSKQVISGKKKSATSTSCAFFVGAATYLTLLRVELATEYSRKVKLFLAGLLDSDDQRRM